MNKSITIRAEAHVTSAVTQTFNLYDRSECQKGPPDMCTNYLRPLEAFSSQGTIAMMNLYLTTNLSSSHIHHVTQKCMPVVQ